MVAVVVYEFETYEPAKRRWTPGTGMASMEAIERMGGVALRKTQRIIDSSMIDSESYLGPNG